MFEIEHFNRVILIGEAETSLVGAQGLGAGLVQVCPAHSPGLLTFYCKSLTWAGKTSLKHGILMKLVRRSHAFSWKSVLAKTSNVGSHEQDAESALFLNFRNLTQMPTSLLPPVTFCRGTVALVSHTQLIAQVVEGSLQSVSHIYPSTLLLI